MPKEKRYCDDCGVELKIFNKGLKTNKGRLCTKCTRKIPFKERLKIATEGAREEIKEEAKEAKEGAKEDWKELKEGAKEDWKELKEGAKEDWKELKEGAKEDWKELKEEAKKAKEGAKEDWKELKEEAKEGWKEFKADLNINSCPKCKSSNIRVLTKDRGLSASQGCCGGVLLGPFGLLCSFCGKDKQVKKGRECRDCGHIF